MIGPSRGRIRAFLEEGAWFGGLPDATRELLLDRGVLRTFAKGQLIQAEGGEGVGLCVVLEGAVRLLRQVERREATLLHIAEPGFWFGQMAVLEAGTPVVSAVARTSTKALVVTKAEFSRAIALDARLERAVNQYFYELVRAVTRFWAQVELPADERLILRLVDLAELRRREIRIEGPVTLNVTQAELAEIISLSRQQLNVRLKTLRTQGLVDVGQRYVRVLDAARLRSIVAESH
jgi:CRP/FNR family transcriptional regulator, cyclic AMP receptor protein